MQNSSYRPPDLDSFTFEKAPRTNFTEIPNRIRRELNLYERDLYWHMLVESNEEQEFKQSTRTIAKEVGMSRTKVSEALQSLVDKGYIQKAHESKPGPFNEAAIYELTDLE